MSTLWMPAAEVTNFNPDRFDFVWNDDYSMFQTIALPWWDDASYLAYQAGDYSEENTEDDDGIARCQGNWGVKCETHDDPLPF